MHRACEAADKEHDERRAARLRTDARDVHRHGQDVEEELQRRQQSAPLSLHRSTPSTRRSVLATTTAHCSHDGCHTVDMDRHSRS